MDKTAKEMFEELGYKWVETITKDNHIVSYQKEFELEIEDRLRECALCVVFNDYTRTIEVEETDYFDKMAVFINYDEFKAINKQVEELGWNNE